MFIKICGLTSVDATRAAVSAGADAVGFVFAKSPRQVTSAAAKTLAREVPDHIIKVAVFRHPDKKDVDEVIDVFAPDWIQTDAEDFAELSIPIGCEPLPVLRNGQISEETKIQTRILFEGKVSGAGVTADWAQAGSLALRTQLILAGGLTPDNVAKAITAVRPWGVDVSSGVESSPGHKDAEKIRLFIARARAMESN